MAREVVPVVAQHLGESALVLGQAFLNDPFWLGLCQGSDDNDRLRRMNWIFAASLSGCLKTGGALELRDQDRLVAAAVLYPPKAYPQPMSEQLALFAKSIWHGGLLRGQTWSIAKRAIEALDQLAKEHPAGVHYYLEYIGVTPDRQGQGLGTHLLKEILQKADEEQAGCYLESANPRAVPLYLRLGFETRGQREIIGVPMWFMWRDPEQLPM